MPRVSGLCTQAGRFLIRLVANRVDMITVRDPDSRDELVSLGVKRPPVYVTADPVLGLDPAPHRSQQGAGKFWPPWGSKAVPWQGFP